MLSENKFAQKVKNIFLFTKDIYNYLQYITVKRDPLFFNKVISSLLIPFLLILIIRELGYYIFTPSYEDEPAYFMESENLSKHDEQIVKLSILEQVAALQGDPIKGSQIFKKCISCHSLGKNNGTGPSLYNILSRKQASVSGFQYSKSFKSLTGTWTEENLIKFINKPSQYIPGNKMSFVGLRKPQDIADIISFFKKQKEET